MTLSARVAAAFSALPLMRRKSGKEESTSFKKNKSNGFGGGGRGTTLAKKIRLIEKKTHHHHQQQQQQQQHRCLSGCVCVSSSASSAKAHRHQKCCSSMTTSFGIFGGDKGRRNSRKTRFLKNKRAGVASNKHNAVASLNAAAMGLANNNNNIIMAQTSLFNLGVNELAWLLSTLYALFCFSICVRAKRGDEKAIANIRNYSTLVPLAIFYGVLLIRSWSDNTLALMMPGSLEEGLKTGEVQFIPKLSGISELLSEKAASASAWAHFMLVNLFVARHATLQSLKFDLPVAHTLALCLVTGPLGLLSHVVTKWIVLKLRSKRSSLERSAENER
jgi:hypothetical protein